MNQQLCELLGINYPIFQGGMAWVADASLASAVSNAGGLGIIAGGNAPKEVVKKEIKKVKELTVMKATNTTRVPTLEKSGKKVFESISIATGAPECR